MELGFVDAANEDFHLTSLSDLIDAGTADIELEVKICKTEDEFDGYDSNKNDKCPFEYKNVNFTEGTDFAGNQRVSGSTIDIGPYEFSSTNPTIGETTYSGDAKVFSELTFTTTVTPSGDRTITSIEYDFNNNNSFSSVKTHKFGTPQTYTIKVKATDSEGEYSINTFDISIAPLPFEEMSLKQKLISLIPDATKINSIMEDINNGETVSSAITQIDIDNLSSGWNLVGTILPITDLSIFANSKIIWIYNNDTSSWSAYSPITQTMGVINSASKISAITTIPANSGVWVLK